LGSYQTAWALLHKLRSGLATLPAALLKGDVEADESYFVCPGCDSAAGSLPYTQMPGAPTRRSARWGSTIGLGLVKRGHGRHALDGLPWAHTSGREEIRNPGAGCRIRRTDYAVLAGSRTVKVVPLPGSDSTEMLPPC
jgi:hypothetical protein